MILAIAAHYRNYSRTIRHHLHTHLHNKLFTDTEPVLFLKDVITQMALISGKNICDNMTQR